MWRQSVWASGIVVLVALSGGCGDDGERLPEVVRREFVAVDSTRRTPPNGAFRGAPDRTIRYLVWQTASAPGERTLLLLAHGFGGLPEKFDALARALAASGLVVVAPAFPLTNQQAPGGHETALRDLVNQPADVSFLLDELQKARQSPGHPLYGAFAFDRMVVLGHSLGAVTLLGLTRKQCCIDERIRAAIFVAAPSVLDAAFGADRADRPPLPSLFLHGEADPVVPITVGRGLYAATPPPRAFLGVLGAGHSDLVESQQEPPIRARQAVQEVVVAFLRAVFGGADEEFLTTLAELRREGHEVEYDWIGREYPAP